MNSPETSIDPGTEVRRAPPSTQHERAPRHETEKQTPTEKAATLFAVIVDQYLREKFSENKDPRERLPFHNEHHTRGVIDRTRAILEAMRAGGVHLSNDDIARGTIAAAAHDLIQRWEENAQQEQFEDRTYTKIIRKRALGPNEQESVEEGKWFVRDLDIPEEAKDKIRTALQDAIPATVAPFDTKFNTVSQPNLHPESSPIARALALADIGNAGMNPDAFLEDGNTFFREDNLDMLDLPDRLQRGEVTPQQEAWYKDRILRWSKFQPKFAEGRKALLDTELGNLPDAAKANVHALFNKFDESIARSRAVAQKREPMALKKILDDVGY